jgi:hypothetical protein
MRLVSAFPFFNMLLRPFVSAVFALVGILKFSAINNYGRAFLQSKVGHHATLEDACLIRTHNLLCSMFFQIFSNELFAHEFDVESASTPWAVPEEFHPRDLLYQLSSVCGKYKFPLE